MSDFMIGAGPTPENVKPGGRLDRLFKAQAAKSQALIADGLARVSGRTAIKAAAMANDGGKPAIAAPAPRFAQADLNDAAAKARAAERAKVAAVFNAPAARGRERAAADFLASAAAESLSAAAIITTLAAMPNDAERERMKARRSQESAAAIWDKAIARAGY